jgi:hypothetical protein
MTTRKRLHNEITTSNTTRTKTTRYIDEFIRLDCAPLLLDLKVFPDAKEITEAMSMFHAYRRFVEPNIKTNKVQGRKCIVCVGDGSTPRCASIFALRCKRWEAIAVDPQMRVVKQEYRRNQRSGKNKKKKLKTTSEYASDSKSQAEDQTVPSNCWNDINRLTPVQANVEDIIIKCEVAIVVLMHCHVDLDVALSCVNASQGVLALITCPCCQWIGRHERCFGRAPDACYLDYGILSDKREVRVWVNSLKSHQKSVVPEIKDLPECTPLSSEDIAQNMKWRSVVIGNEKKEANAGIAKVMAFRKTVKHLDHASKNSMTVTSAQEYVISFINGTSSYGDNELLCPSHCIVGLHKSMPILENESKADRNSRQVFYLANLYYNNIALQPKESLTNSITFHGVVVRKRCCASISFYTLMPVGSTRDDGKRAQKAWTDAAKGAQTGKKTAISQVGSVTSSSSSSSLKKVSVSEQYTYNAVQICLASTFIPEVAWKNGNPAKVWQKCVKVGDHLEVTGCIGRSSSGQPSVYVYDLAIIGHLGRIAV